MARQARLRAAVAATLLALVAAVLLPTLARAGLAPGATAWTEICTVQGTRLVALAEGGETTASLHDAWAHCPLCASQAAAPPPATPAAPGPWQASAMPAPRAAPAPGRTAGVWPAPRPRGPPTPTRRSPVAA